MRFARLRANPAVRIALDFHREWSRDRVGGLAAEIAFFALLGLFPAVIAFAAALSWLDVVIGQGAAADARAWLLDQVIGVFGADNTLQSTLADLFERSNTGALTVGTALVLYASSRGFVAVVKALDVAYNLDLDERRGWLSSRLVGLGLTAFTVAVAALVVTMIVVGPLLGGGEEIAGRFGAGSAFTAAWNWLRWPVVFGVVVVWATTVYRVAPRQRVPWRRELPGAVVATAWWMAVSLGFRTYLDAVSDGGQRRVRAAGRGPERAGVALPAGHGPAGRSRDQRGSGRRPPSGRRPRRPRRRGQTRGGRNRRRRRGGTITGVSDLRVDLDEIKFNLRGVADLDGVAALPGFEHVEADLVDDLLAEAARFAEEVIAPLKPRRRPHRRPPRRRRPSRHPRRGSPPPTPLTSRPGGGRSPPTPTTGAAASRTWWGRPSRR